jgi:hypothetical protein
MKTKICFVLTIVAALAACRLQAQGTLTASASLLETGMSGNEYTYSLTLTNTGSNPINAFWYGWTRGSFNLPSVPTSIAGPAGWTASASSFSVQFGNSSGSAIAPGATGTFTFQSTNTPTQMTTGTHEGDPTGDSVAYATVAAMNAFDQSVPGVASAPFTPTLNPGTLTAAATILETGTSGGEFEYSLTLTNTGSNPINAFWYGWTIGSFNLPSIPTSIVPPTGWTATISSDSVQFGNSTGSAIAPGAIGTFTFESTSDPTQMTTGTHEGDPTGESIAYATVAAMNICEQSVPGVASDPFTPTLDTGTLSAAATILETGTSGSEFEYSLTLTNTGSNPINAFWYGWTKGSFNLPSVPTNIVPPTGWTATTSSDSIQFANSTGSAIAPGATGTFTFQSTNTPIQMTSGTNDGDATGESVAYATVAAMSSFDESVPGVASGPFTPTLNPGTLSAGASLLETGTSGGEFLYSLTLTNTGSNPINALWYGWTKGSFNLPSVPTGIVPPTGWTATAVSDSIQFANSTGSAVAPGATLTFTFESTNTPTQMTSGTNDGDATGESVAYATVAAMSSFDESVPGVASGPFTPTLNPGTLSAGASLLETGTSGSEFLYSLTLTNTGSNPINALWYGWTKGSFNLPSVPSGIVPPTGWTATAVSDSIQFANSTGSAVAPGATLTFTFESTNTPTQMTSGTNDGDPTGESVAYATVAAMSSFDESVAGVASGPFTPTLNPGTLSAAASIIETGTSGNEFLYSLTLTNTGINPINAFWYGWTKGSFNLPSVPTGIVPPTGWTATVVSDSIQFANSTGGAIAPGATGTFAFESTNTPTQMTSGTNDGDPTGESVAYATVAAMSSFEQSVPGVASDPFTPALGIAPPLPPQFQAPALVGGSLQLSWTSVSGTAYQVQYSTNLSQTNWINFGNVITADTNSTTTNDLLGSDSQRFYRVVILP